MRSGLLGVLLLGACGSAPAEVGGEDNTAGMGVPQQFPSEAFPGERRRITVEVHLAGNGCFLGTPADADRNSRYLIVWPAGTEQGAAGDELRLPDGTSVRAGDVLTGEGLGLPTRRLGGFGGDSYWDFAVGFCAPGASEVLVLDRVDERSDLRGGIGKGG